MLLPSTFSPKHSIQSTHLLVFTILPRQVEEVGMQPSKLPGIGGWRKLRPLTDKEKKIKDPHKHKEFVYFSKNKIFDMWCF